MNSVTSLVKIDESTCTAKKLKIQYYKCNYLKYNYANGGRSLSVIPKNSLFSTIKYDKKLNRKKVFEKYLNLMH